jgi:predicted alpha/beta superfamily hydrolase
MARGRSSANRVGADVKGIFDLIVGLFVLLCLVALAAGAQTQEPSAVTVPPRVEIAGTQLLHLSSAITKKDYDLYINLPRGYGDTSKTFPALFVLDAQWDFPLAQAIYGQQYYDGFIPELVIVGITWGGKNPDYDQLRAYDLTPTDIGLMMKYGNAPKFLSFITKELIPFVESKFRIKKNDRALMGSSFGGLFTLYAMFQEPGVFNRFVLTSPSIQWDNKQLSSLNKSFAEQHKELAAKVFMGIGEYENVSELQNFAEELKSKNYKSFELQTKVIAGMGHSGGKAEGYTRGLQAVFARPNVKSDTALLASYTGEYMINGQFKVKLAQKQGSLVGVFPDGSTITFCAESDVDFYVTGTFMNVHIEKDQAGSVSGFTVRQYSGSMFCKRVK